MSRFKVGDRVRIVQDAPGYRRDLPQGCFVGCEATISRVGPWFFNRNCDYGIRIDGFPELGEGDAMEWELSPLDPRCSEFIADCERFSKLATPMEKLKALFGEAA